MRRRAAVLLLLPALLAAACASGAAEEPGRGAKAAAGAVAGAPAPRRPFAALGERLLDGGTAMYPRLLRLRDGRVLLSVMTGPAGGITDTVRFYASADEGRTFAPLSALSDSAAAQGRGGCCGAPFEPSPGVLLWAATTGMKNRAPGRRAALRVWRSTDGGRTWAYLSSCAEAPPGTRWDRGLWEPELALDAAGRLVCLFSDETVRGHPQVIASVTSGDGGATWGPRRILVGGGPRDRPGMPVVRRLPSGTYLMAYELCGRSGCGVRLRTSPDGQAWGPAVTPRDVGGRTLFHAPTLALLPGGRVLLVGGLVRDARGRLDRAASGTTVFTNVATGPAGRWLAEPAPVRVPFSANPTAAELVCANYSSALLPVASGQGLLEAATRPDGGTCRAYTAALPLLR
ncbi:sialidase family protein [Actinomadura parmotrematis]|uniref:Glycoside hydrolase n=1 Tax=Actinomadura parmotrematis TaxID=2864039 RepID=A0ABS7FY03_9ACTN|nr:sialidase family protein [Actinomadura parmotrematis]MBW8485308.1 glycoside hydrolase [Actinomadura parmotrematis]